MLTVVDAHPLDAIYLGPRLRKPDQIEVKVTGKTPEEAINDGFTNPNAKIYTGVDKNSTPVFIFGSVRCPHDENAGVVWMLGSDELDKNARSFLKISKQWIDEISKDYNYVYNLVHKDNTKSIRWLKWSGFTVDTSRTYNKDGEDFYLLIKET